MLWGENLLAQVPNISYATPNPAPYPIGTAITILTPANIGGATTSGFYSFTTFISLTANAYGVATDAFSNVYTVDYHGGTGGILYKFNSSAIGGAVNTGTTLAGPDILTIDGANNIYISDFTNNVVYKFNSSGTLLSTITGPTGGFGSPYGLATDASNNLYVADLTNNDVVKVLSGATTGTVIQSGFNGAYGVAIVGNDLYVSEEVGNDVIKITNGITTGTTKTTFATGFSGPRNIGNDASGNIYVADFGNNRVQVVPPAGGTGSTVISGLSQPRDVTFDISGNLYIANGVADQIIRSIPGNYSISPVLPAGLSFNSATGAISGTPTSLSSPTVYTITGGNLSGTSAATVTISTIAAAPSLSFGSSSYTLGLNNAMAPLTPTNSGGAIPATVYGTVSLFAGSATGATGSSNTGTGTFKTPSGINVTNAGNIYVADKANDLIRSITSAGAVATFGGTAGTAGRSNIGTGTFSSPSDVTNDFLGNLYVADFTNNEIRKLTSAPVVSLLAGSTTGVAGLANSPTSPVLFSSPSGSAYDLTTGAIYIADQANHLIRKVVASSGSTSTFGTGVTYTAPTSVAVDASGNVYVADKTTNLITKITTAGAASTFAGSGTAASTDGTGTGASFNAPDGITVDNTGNIYVSDGGGNKIRRITPAAVVTTVAGSGTAGHGSGVGTAATFSAPAGLDIDPTTGNIFVADAGSNEIRKIIGTGYTISPTTLPAGLSFNSTTGTISGTPTANAGPTTYTITGFNAAGSSAATVQLTVQLIPPAITYNASPVALEININVGTTPNPAIAVTNTGGAVPATTYSTVSTFAAAGTNIDNPRGIVSDGLGNIYEADFATDVIYKITGGTVALIAGKLNTPGTTTNTTGANARFTTPTGITYDGVGNLYVADYGNNLIRVISTTSPYNVTTLAGAGGAGAEANGTGTAAKFNSPYGITYDGAGNLYVTDITGNTIRKIVVSSAVVTTLTTGLNAPAGIVYDGSTNLYVANSVGHTIAQVPVSTGTATTFAGSGTSGSTNGTGTAATFNTPYGLAFDASGNLIVADEASNLIRTITTPGAVVTTLAGSGTAGEGNAVGTAATFTTPYSVCADNAGNIFVGDNSGATSTVREIALTGYTVTPALPAGLTLTSSTGAITGKATASSAPTDYTVTGYNAAGSGSTIININCYAPFIWVGATGTAGTVWGTTTNWSGGKVPTSSDEARIGADAGIITNMPVIPTGSTISIGSILMGTAGTTTTTPVITVNGTGVLNVSGDITFQSNNAGTATLSPAALLTGTGTINANNLNVTLANATSTASYNETLSSNISTLNLIGDVTLISAKTTGTQNANFSLTGGILTTDGFVTTSANAGNAPTFAISNNTTLQFTGTAPLSGLSTPGTAAITGLSGTGVTISYTGNNAQTVYTDAAIPFSSLTSGISYTNITFSGTTGIKTALTGNLNVSGNFTNSLVSDTTTTYVDFSAPTTVKFTGTAQALAGGTGFGTTFYNVAISGVGTKTMSGKFAIASTGIVNMTGANTTILNAGTNLLTLKSDGGSSAAIGALSGPVINGTVNVQRFITGGAGTRGYRLLSSPVNAGGTNSAFYSINYIANSCYITGLTPTTGGIDKAGNPTLFLFREDKTPSQTSFTAGNFRGVDDMYTGTTNITYLIDIDGSVNIPVSNGFLFFFRGDRSVAPIATETVSTYVPTNTTLTAIGTLNQGNITFKDWFTPTVSTLSDLAVTGNSSILGYNLIGNPYASPISWTSVYAASTNVGVSVYEFNPFTNQYGAYVEGASGGTGGFGDIIGSGQGFFAVASNSSATVNFTEAVKSTSQPSTLLMGLPVGGTVAQQYIHLKMIKDTVNYDDIILGFKPGTSTKYSINEDGLHLTGNSPPETLAALSSDSVNLSISYMPLPNQTQQTVGLNVNATASGAYTFSRTGLVGIPTIYEIWLKDNLLKDSLDLRANTTYAFNIDKTNPATYGTNRFQIVIRQNPALGLNLLAFAAAKIPNASQVSVNWTVANEANYTTFYVQRSTDNGKTFQSVGSLQSDGSGTYTFIDKSPVTTGQDQYRLQLSDVNNTITYSNVVTIQYSDLSNNTLANNISLYPNPAHDLINMSVTGSNPTTAASYTVTITNSIGTIVKTTTSSQSTWQNNVSNLLPGTYFVQVIDNSSKAVIGRNKFIKL